MAKKPEAVADQQTFIRTLVGDLRSPRSLRVLRGIVSESWRDESLRLYFDISFQTFVDIAKEDVVAQKTIANDQSPFDMAYVWINLDSDLNWSPTMRSRSTLPAPTLICSITDNGCGLSTTHFDCNTPTFNMPGCGGVTLTDCPVPTDDDCSVTTNCDTNDCVTRSSARRRRYW